MIRLDCYSFFFFNDTATTAIYTLSLYDALPIFETFSDGVFAIAATLLVLEIGVSTSEGDLGTALLHIWPSDRKSTRLNSSHPSISYAVFCLKKKKNKITSHIARSRKHGRRLHPL